MTGSVREVRFARERAAGAGDRRGIALHRFDVTFGRVQHSSWTVSAILMTVFSALLSPNLSECSAVPLHVPIFLVYFLHCAVLYSIFGFVSAIHGRRCGAVATNKEDYR